MKISHLLAVAATAALLLPGTALAGNGDGNPTGKTQRATETQTIKFRTLEGPTESPENVTLPEYGRLCAGQSRKSVAGQRGTAFSRCVTAMARVATGRKSAKAACKGLSKKHVKGTKGTPFSRCVVAAAKLRETAPVTEPVPAAPTEPVTMTDPVDPPVA